MPGRYTNADAPLAPEVEAWERQPWETENAYQAFASYRDQIHGQPERSIRQLATQTDTSYDSLRKMAPANQWVARARAYDVHRDRQARAQRADELDKLTHRQSTQLQAAASALTQPIQALVQRIATARGTSTDPFAGISTRDLARLATQSSRALPRVIEAERLINGLTTHNVGTDAATTPQQAADSMGRSEMNDYLLGLDDGRQRLLDELGITDPTDPQAAADPPPTE